jgi:hypothetical protein
VVLTIEIEQGGRLVLHELFADSEGSIGDIREIESGVVLRKVGPYVERRTQLAEPEPVRFILELAGRISDVGGAAAAIYAAAKVGRAAWVKINGRSVRADEESILKAIEEERDDEGKTIRLVED